MAYQIRPGTMAYQIWVAVYSQRMTGDTEDTDIHEYGPYCGLERLRSAE